MPKKQDTSSWWTHPLVLVGVTIVWLIISASLWRTQSRMRQAGSQLQTIETEVQQLQQETASLEAELEQAKTPQTQEYILRDELLLQKEGEQVIQLPPMPSSTPTPSTSPTPPPFQAWRALMGI